MATEPDYISIAIQEASDEDTQFDAPRPDGHGDEAGGDDGIGSHGADGLGCGPAVFPPSKPNSIDAWSG